MLYKSEMKARETKGEEGVNSDAKLGKWSKHTCSGRLIGGPHACSIVDSTVLNYVARARTPFVNVPISVLTSSCTYLNTAAAERRCATVADMSNTPPP